MRVAFPRVFCKNTYMRMLLFLFCALCLPLNGAAVPVAEEPEIIIELTGEPDPVNDGISVWNKNAKQLEKFFKNKTREDVLYTVDTVSSLDILLKSSNGKKYRYVRYGQDDGDYRKFLFDDKDKLLACADEITQVLSLNQKYQINLGASESDFLRTFPDSVLTNLVDFNQNQDLQAYQITLPQEKAPSYFIFSNELLKQTFRDERSYNDYVTQLSLQNQQWLEQEHERQQKQLEQLRQEKEEAIRRAREERHRWKALVTGGTIEDQLYLPRVRDPEKYKLPPLVPSTTPAGMPIILN